MHVRKCFAFSVKISEHTQMSSEAEINPFPIEAPQTPLEPQHSFKLPQAFK